MAQKPALSVADKAALAAFLNAGRRYMASDQLCELTRALVATYGPTDDGEEMLRAQGEVREAVRDLLRSRDLAVEAISRAGGNPEPLLVFAHRADADAGRSHAAWEPAKVAVQVALVAPTPNRESAKRSGQGKARSRSKADQVRTLLTGDAPYEGAKSQLAAEVGYTDQSSLARVKGFLRLWNENEQRVHQGRADRKKRMARPRSI